MGLTKTDLFDEKANTIASLFKALGHPARIAIIEYILQQKSCICSNLVDVLPLAQATISQHLKALKDVGILKGTVEGTSMCYCIDEKQLQLIQHYIKEWNTQLNQTTNCC